MDGNEIMALLPERPRDGMIEAAMSANAEQFGGAYLIYRRESVVEEKIPLKDAMNPEDWAAYRKGIRYHWATACACTECGQTTFVGWGKGGTVDMYQGPDGTFYEGIPSGAWDGDPYVEVSHLSEGDTIICPFCDDCVTLIRRSSLRRPRAYRLMVASVENVGDDTAVLFWMVSRTLYADGYGHPSAKPCAAMVIDRDGEPLFFLRARFAFAGKMIPADKWKQVDPRRATDPLQQRYHSYEAVNHTKVGGWTWPDVPDLTGRTGEKTGLADYVRDGGGWPALYLLFWRKRPAVENLVKSGWTFTLDDCIATEATQRGRLRFPESLEILMNWEAVRPRDILSVSRKAAKMGRVWRWDCGVFSLWKELLYFGCAHPDDAEDFQTYLTEYGYMNMNRFVAYVTDGADYAMAEIDRYLKRQRRKYGLDLQTGIASLFDYRDMLDETLRARTPTPDELWPKNLRAAHDRMAETLRTLHRKATADFQKILERWGALEWTDGECRALLPRCAEDLTDEGHALHHCVGGYAKSHAEGKIVVFIRRYRRPERSWFTLNEDLTGDRPRRIQLHGYGNEYAHGKRLTIPKKVLDFCDRWERDVLIPTFQEVRRREAEEKKPAKRKRRKDAENGAVP